ncbi:MAG TPA: glutaredoxin [Deltaproteobacteria bacterium]|nr:glutaredoxin [Deltaproteobacteria bacterium]
MDRRDPPPTTDAVRERQQRFHADTLDEVCRALSEHEVVVVGMAWNPHVGRARRALDAAGVPYHYLGYGSYASGWKTRLAIKLWSRWPTFPQVFVSGTLIGGADETLAWVSERQAQATAAP